MRTQRFLVIASLFAPIACTDQQPAPRGGAAAALAAQAEYRKAIEVEDLGGIQRLMSLPPDSTTFYFPARTGDRGLDAYRSWFAECDSIRLTYANLEAHASPAGDAAVVTYLEDGREVCDGRLGTWASRRATVLWERVDEKWHLVHGHWSDAAPPDTITK